MLKMNEIVEIKRYSNFFKISWKMTNWCNYRCPYCYMSSSVKQAKFTSEEYLLNIANKLDSIIEKQAKDRPVCLHLIGGEVGYFDLIKILKCIKSENLKLVIIVTNFSNSLNYWKKISSYLKKRNCELRISASLHLEQCNIEEFLKKAKIMSKEVRIKCVINDSNVNKYKELFTQNLLNNLQIQPTLERDTNNKNSLVSKETKEYIDYLNGFLDKKMKPYYVVKTKDGKEHVFYSNIEMINNIENGGLDPEGFKCTAGLDGLRINIDGTLRRAGCQWCGKQENWLGDLITGEYILPTEPIVCHTTIQHKFLGERHRYCTAFGNMSIFK